MNTDNIQIARDMIAILEASLAEAISTDHPEMVWVIVDRNGPFDFKSAGDYSQKKGVMRSQEIECTGHTLASICARFFKDQADYISSRLYGSKPMHWRMAAEIQMTVLSKTFRRAAPVTVH